MASSMLPKWSVRIRTPRPLASACCIRSRCSKRTRRSSSSWLQTRERTASSMAQAACTQLSRAISRRSRRGEIGVGEREVGERGVQTLPAAREEQVRDGGGEPPRRALGKSARHAHVREVVVVLEPGLQLVHAVSEREKCARMHSTPSLRLAARAWRT